MNRVLYDNNIYLVDCVKGKDACVMESLASKDAYPWVQFGWHGWHSRSWSAYLKMKLFAPCKPSGHFSTQFGPSLKWEHFVQLSGPWSVKNKTQWRKKSGCSFLWYWCGLVPKTSVSGQSSPRELESIFKTTNGDVTIAAFQCKSEM